MPSMLDSLMTEDQVNKVYGEDPEVQNKQGDPYSITHLLTPEQISTIEDKDFTDLEKRFKGKEGQNMILSDDTWKRLNGTSRIKDFFGVGKLNPDASREDKLRYYGIEPFTRAFSQLTVERATLGQDEMLFEGFKKVMGDKFPEEWRDMTWQEIAFEGGPETPGYSKMGQEVAGFIGRLKAIKGLGIGPKAGSSIFDYSIATANEWGLSEALEQGSRLAATKINPDADIEYGGAQAVALTTASGGLFGAAAGVGVAVKDSKWFSGMSKAIVRKFPKFTDWARKNPDKSVEDFVDGAIKEHMTAAELFEFRQLPEEAQRAVIRNAARGLEKRMGEDVVIAATKTGGKRVSQKMLEAAKKMKTSDVADMMKALPEGKPFAPDGSRVSVKPDTGLPTRGFTRGDGFIMYPDGRKLITPMSVSTEVATAKAGVRNRINAIADRLANNKRKDNAELRNILANNPELEAYAENAIYDELLERANSGDRWAINRLNDIIQQQDKITYEELLEQAVAGNEQAVLAIQRNDYRWVKPTPKSVLAAEAQEVEAAVSGKESKDAEIKPPPEALVADKPQGGSLGGVEPEYAPASTEEVGGMVQRIEAKAAELGVNLDPIEWSGEYDILDYYNPEHRSWFDAHKITEQEYLDAKANRKEFVSTATHKAYRSADGSIRSRITLHSGATLEDGPHELVHAIEEQGGIPGWTGTKEEHAKFLEDLFKEGREGEVSELTGKGSKVGEATVPQPQGAVEVEPVKKEYTSVPKEWFAEKNLVDRGKTGIHVSKGNAALPAGDGTKRKRKSFIWNDQFSEIPVRLENKEVMKRAAELTDEIVKVKNTRGDDYYYAPKEAVELLKKELGSKWNNQRPVPERSPKQKFYDELNSMERDLKRGREGATPADVGANLVLSAEEKGISLDELSERALKFIQEYEDAKTQGLINDIHKGMEQEISVPENISPEQAEERLAIQEEELLEEHGGFLDGILEEEHGEIQTDFFGRPELQGGASGSQISMFDKGDFKTLSEKERLNAEADIEGQQRIDLSIRKIHQEKIGKMAVDHFGITNDIREAGYILPDGTMLDLSGRHHAGGYKRVGQFNKPESGKPDYLRAGRATDHRELDEKISNYLEENKLVPEVRGGSYSNTLNMISFQNASGAMRIDAQGDHWVISTVGMPNTRQIEFIAKKVEYGTKSLSFDIDDNLGLTIKSGYIDSPTPNKVKRFYNDSRRKLEAEPGDPEINLSIRKINTSDLPKKMKENFTVAVRMGVKQPLGGIVKIAHKIHDSVYSFGEVKRTQPELYEKLMESYGRRNAGIEAAVSLVDKELGKFELSREDAVKLSLIYEDKSITPPAHLAKAYEAIKDVMDWLEKTQIDEGIFQRPFSERMIAENNDKIDLLRAKMIQMPATKAEIAALEEENKVLARMRYLPHTAVAQNVMSSKINSLDGRERADFAQQISGQFKMRKGKMFLKDYLEEGIIEPSDIDVRKLMANSIADFYYRGSMKMVMDYAKEEGWIKPASQELRDLGWHNAQEIGVRSPELKEQLVHPLMAQQLNKMASMRAGQEGGWISSIMGMVKVGQFLKPSIIWVYNAMQKYMKGMYSLNPVTEAKAMAEAAQSVWNKDALYHRLNESNLFQFPYEIPRVARKDAIDRMISLASKDTGKTQKLLEYTTGQSWDTEFNNPDFISFLKNANKQKILMLAHQEMGQLTWMGDKMQRTQSYLILRHLGYEHDEAVSVASKSHGGYSLLSTGYKKALSKIFFVYSFRWLMPVELGKILAEPVAGGYKWAKYGKEPKPHEKRRWTQALIATLLIPYTIDKYMDWRGFEKEGKHIGPLAWKWKKSIKGPTRDPKTGELEDMEIVVGMNNILNIPVKYWNRLSYSDPTRPENVYWQKFKNLLKWELHPLYRIFAWDLAQNRRSFGTGMQVYDPSDTPAKQLFDSAKYVFGQSFRFYGNMMDAAGEGSMTDKERREQTAIYDAHLNQLDKILFSVFGYKYARMGLAERKQIKLQSLRSEYTSRVYNIQRKYDVNDPIVKEKLKRLNEWNKRSVKWIKNEMK